MILPLTESNTETLQDRIIRHEGFNEFPQIDISPMYVIGFGHDITKAECDNYSNGITWDDAEKLLEADLATIKENCAKEFPWVLGLDETRREVILEMCFQLGVGGVSQFRDMISAIRDQDWDSAAQEMLSSKWHQETPSRCEELASLMLKGYTGNNSTS